MKKLLLISAVLAAMFFMVSCENKLTSVSTHDVDDNTADSGKTGKEGGECYEDKSCDEGLSCEEERNLCVKNEDAGDDSDSLTDTDDDNDHGETFIRTIQFFTNENGVEVFNPFVIALTNISATAGSNHYGIVGSYNPTGLIMIVDADITDNDLDISCYHAFSEGELDIQNIVPSAGSEGALAVSGTIDLYSPKNYAYSLGDISAQLDVPVCNPQ